MSPETGGLDKKEKQKVYYHKAHHNCYHEKIYFIARDSSCKNGCQLFKWLMHLIKKKSDNNRLSAPVLVLVLRYEFPETLSYLLHKPRVRASVTCGVKPILDFVQSSF